MNLLGEILKEQGKITMEDLGRGLALQKVRGVSLGQIFVKEGLIIPEELDRALAVQLNLAYIDLPSTGFNLRHFDKTEVKFFIDNLVLPISDKEWVTADITRDKKQMLLDLLGEGGTLKVTSRFNLLYHLHLSLKDQLSDLSIHALAKSYPHFSAGRVIEPEQLWSLYIGLSVAVFWLFLAPWSFLLTLNVLVTCFLITSFLFKFLLVWKGSHSTVDRKVNQNQVNSLLDFELPTYTILVPMYKEPEVLPMLVKSLANLDYPKEKLDIKIVLEEDDLETLEKVNSLNLRRDMEIVVVPKSLPKTKPKACNYALQFARGEYLTIYDAEDRPESDQLKKAYWVFKHSPPHTAVVQARLNFFNAQENWITRMFTMEYALWFDFYLPALERLKVPIPLGGTSNHFKTDILRGAGGWDPFNVTEDADLGIRFTQLGYTVAVVNSTTLEEANTQYHNWIRQRSRWMKGYMQTYLVHMRSPLKLWKQIGNKAFFSFQFFIGGTFLTALLTPFLYSVSFWWLISRTNIFDKVFIEPLLYISLLNLLLGNAFFIYVQMIGVFKRKLYSLIPWALTTPVYWLMLSVAAAKGLGQLITNPFYWEKTQHGLSKYTQGTVDESK